MNDVRVERTSEGDELWTWHVTVQSNSSSTAAKMMKQEFVYNWRITLTTVVA